MIKCDPRVYIESGNGSVESVHALTEEGYGVLFMNEVEPVEVGTIRPMREDFDPEKSTVTWVFKNIASLDVAIKNLNRLRSDMEAFENGDFEEE